MPKAAICFWGLCRSTDKTIDSIITNIYDVLKQNEIDYDVFVHTYSVKTAYTNKRSNESSIELDNDLYLLLNTTNSIIEDKDTVDRTLQFKRYRLHGDPWETKFESLDNHIRALYSLYKVTQMYKENIKNYDIVIYARPDVLFLDPLNPNWFNLQEGTVISPNDHPDLPMNDRFAIAKPQTALVYGERYSKALHYSKFNQLHSERFLYNVLKDAKIMIIDVPFRFTRIRASITESH